MVERRIDELSSLATLPDAVVVTGAGRGIGRRSALDLGESGCDILCLSQSDNSDRTAAEIKAVGGSADSAAIDLSDYLAVEKVVAEWVNDRAGQTVGAVLAAASTGPTGPLSATALSDWDRTFRVNVLGNVAVVHALLGHMTNTGFGRVVAFGGGGAAYAYPVLPAYAASKACLVRIIENLAQDMETTADFAAVCLAPGAIETDTLAHVRSVGGVVKTVAKIEEPVRFVKSFLASSGAPAISGRFVHVRDEWAQVLEGERELEDDHWTLRRVE